MERNFIDAVKARRSYYGISKEKVVSDERIEEIVKHAVFYTPTAFNSQSGRVILLLNKEHDKLWDMVMEALRKHVPADKFESTEQKINSFKAGYGTVVYFEDEDITKGLQEQFPSYAHNFPKWAEQANGMLQYIVGVSLEQEGFGASLQHYSELITEEFKKEYNITDNWRMVAQMPFGKPTMTPGEKDFTPIEGRLKTYK
ncbi:nitroreductase family protein [Tissierella creatinini]|nr:nitroreductase family protein [Tissierella creatinini]TJX65599.1 nitroreductase family protein [Soehngenia saccharolytica]